MAAAATSDMNDVIRVAGRRFWPPKTAGDILAVLRAPPGATLQNDDGIELFGSDVVPAGAYTCTQPDGTPLPLSQSHTSEKEVSGAADPRGTQTDSHKRRFERSTDPELVRLTDQAMCEVWYKQMVGVLQRPRDAKCGTPVDVAEHMTVWITTPNGVTREARILAARNYVEDIKILVEPLFGFKDKSALVVRKTAPDRYEVRPERGAVCRHPQGIPINPMAGVELPASSGVEVFVKTLTGRTITLEVDLDMSVAVFKFYVQALAQVPASDMRMFYAGRNLDDTLTLAQHKIAKMSTIHLVLSLSGGKPVICFYPPTLGPHARAMAKHDISARVAFSPDLLVGTKFLNPYFTALHPIPDEHKPGHSICWSSTCTSLLSPSGNVMHNGREYPYLFWEFEADPLDPTFGPAVLNKRHDSSDPLFCIESGRVGPFLDAQLELMGLNVRERADMATFWLHSMQQRPFVILRFLPQKLVDAALPLEISLSSGCPVDVHRVYFVWAGADSPRADGLFSTGLGSGPHLAPFGGPSLHPPKEDSRPVDGGLATLTQQAGFQRNPEHLTVVEWGAIHVHDMLLS